MAKKPGFGQLILAPPAAIDPSQVHDVSARMNTPAAPPQMSADFIAPINTGIPKPWKPSALAVLDGVLGGMTFTDSIRSEEARHEAEALQPQMQALQLAKLKAASGLDGRELLAFMTNPGKYGESLSTRFGAANVEGGASRVFGEPGTSGASVFTAPKFGVEDHTAIKMGPEGLSILGQLPRKPEFQVLKPGDNLFRLPSDGTPAAPALAPASAPAGSIDPDAVWRAAIQQESGGRPGVIGPDTPYGNAQGLSQMLPATAQAMASKLGVAWRPELMTAKTPEAAAYQEQLGRAYFDEGLQKYGGDPRKALAFYHGGPNEALWGPKTAAHVNAVMARLGGSEDAPLMGGPAGDQLQAPSGMQPIASGGPVQPSVPAGYRLTASGDLQFIPGGPADPAVKTTAGLKPVPAAIQSSLLGNKSTIRQIDEAIAAIQSNPRALGLHNLGGDAFTQRADPNGIDVRAKVANIGSQIIHDRSGAAVTAAETPRLKPFVPSAIDTPDAAIKKLMALRQQAVNATTGIELAYGEDSGYRPLSAQEPTAQGTPAREKGWSKALPAPQIETAKKFKGTTAPSGDPKNPFVPRNAAEFKNIPPGKSYVDDDGSIQVKR